MVVSFALLYFHSFQTITTEKDVKTNILKNLFAAIHN